MSDKHSTEVRSHEFCAERRTNSQWSHIRTKGNRPKCEFHSRQFAYRLTVTNCWSYIHECAQTHTNKAFCAILQRNSKSNWRRAGQIFAFRVSFLFRRFASAAIATAVRSVWHIFSNHCSASNDVTAAASHGQTNVRYVSFTSIQESNLFELHFSISFSFRCRFR